MAEGKQRDEWDRLSSLMAWIGDRIGFAANGKDHKPIDPAELNPFTAKVAQTANAAATTEESYELAEKSGAWKKADGR
jgi:hypothetical protein